MQVISAVLICYLLWRVETLSDLSMSQSVPFTAEEGTATSENMEDNGVAQIAHDNIGALLQAHCADTQLYLQHDLNLSQLAQAIGTNRTYLTNYFVSQGITYNTYINNLRIKYFLSHYHEAVASKRFFTAQELAHESGYQSYSTFSLAFKNRMGQTVTAWMRDSAR